MRFPLISFLATFSLILFFSPSPIRAACLPDAKPLNHEKPVIRISVGNWLSSQLNGFLLKTIIEEMFGHPCELFDNGATDHVVSFTEYGVDVAWEMWYTQNAVTSQQLQDPIFDNLHETGCQGREGWFIPDYLLDYASDLEGWRGFLVPDNVRVLKSDYAGNLTEEKNIFERLRDQALVIANAPNTTTPEEEAEMNQDLLDMIDDLQEDASETINSTDFGEVWTPDIIEQWDTYEGFLVEQLGLPLKLKYIPSPVEETLVQWIQDMYAQRKPFLTYFYTPSHVFDPRFGVNLKRVQLLDWIEDCEDGEVRPQCLYAVDRLKGGVSVNLLKKSIMVSEFLKKFRYRSTQEVNKMMADVKLENNTNAEAACRYVIDNRGYIESFFAPPQTPIYIAWDSGAGIVLTVVSLLLILLSLGIAIYLNVNSKNVVVMAASIKFCNIILFGSIVGYTAVLTFLGEPNNVNCVFRPILLSCSFGVMYISLLMKNFRIWRIFAKPFASSNKFLSDKNLIIAGFVGVAVEFLILVIWFAVDYPNPDFSESLTEILLSCQSNDPGFGTRMVWVLFAYNCVLIVLGLFLAVETRRVSSRFRESRFIGLAIYNIVVLGVVFIPFITVEDLTTAMNKQVILCVLIILVPAFTVIILFAPKIFYIIKPELAPSYDTSRERSSSHRDKSLTKQFPLPKSASEAAKSKAKVEAEAEVHLSGDEAVDEVHMHETNVLDRGLNAMKTGTYEEGY